MDARRHIEERIVYRRVPAPVQGAFFVRMVHTKFMSVAGYLVFVAGLGALCVYLSHHVGTHAVAVASPYLMVATSERPMTLVEKRQIEGATVLVAEAAPAADTGEAYVLNAPSIPAGVLAAQMDVSEGVHMAKAKPAVVRRVSRARTVRRAKVAAADVFGRSFGVMLMASR